MLRYTLTAAAICFAAGSASAVTLSYDGLNYENIFGSSDGPCAESCSSGVYPDGYNTAMNVTFEFELDRRISPGETLSIFIDGSSIGPDILSYTASDGLYTRVLGNSELSGSITADASGAITEWSLLLEAGEPVDVDVTRSASDGGDVASHVREYIPVDFEPENSLEVGVAFFVASVDQPGTWSYSDVAAVPVPAGLPLILSGIGLVAFAGRHKRKSL